MNGIPAASINDVDLDRLDAERAAELRSLAASLAAGGDTAEQLVRLCELLLFFGQLQTAERLLLANAAEGNAAHDLFQKHFSDAARQFEAAVDAFRDQFHVSLLLVRASRLLCKIGSCRPIGPIAHDHPLRDLLATGNGEVQFTYIETGILVADVYLTNTLASPATALLYEQGRWIPDPQDCIED